MCIRATNRLRRTHLQVLPVCMWWQSGLCAGALKTAKHLGGRGNGRGKRCEQCFCGFLTMRSSYLWNVCMTVCGWGTGGQHCDSQLHLKQTESPKRASCSGYSVVVQLPLAPSPPPPPTHTNIRRCRSCWFSETRTACIDISPSTAWISLEQSYQFVKEKKKEVLKTEPMSAYSICALPS